MMEVRNSGFLQVIPLLITICFLSYPAYAKYSGGSGEPNDPYQIAIAEDLMLLGESPEDYDKHFIMTADIDLDPNLPGRKVFNKAVISPDVKPIEWDFQGTSFNGVFDGNGHIITNLTIRGWSYLGLFGELGYGATVKNLGLDGIYINGIGDYVGGLVGQTDLYWYNSFGSVSIINCYSTGTVSGADFVGGLVGANNGNITSSYNTATVIGLDTIGGLVGENWGHITKSYSNGTVTGNEDIGGLVGINIGLVTASCVTSTITADFDVGGLVGRNLDTITNCYSLAHVEGKASVGGLVGRNGHVGAEAVRPVRVYGTISKSYSAGIVVEMDSGGGLVGSQVDGEITNSFWDIQMSGQAESGGGIGITTDEMQTASTFLEAGWDFVDENDNGTEDIWKISEGLDYPRLWWEPSKYSGGTGEPNKPYKIATADDLMLLGESPDDYDKHFILTADIDLDPNLPGRKIFDGAVIAPDMNDVNDGFQGTDFNGVFDGNGHAILHLTIVGNSYLGLFGQIQSGAKILNLCLEAVDINEMGEYAEGQSFYLNSYVGGLVGFNSEGIITNSNCTGIVSGTVPVGGLVGWNSKGIITNSYSQVTVNGIYSVGGLVGFNEGGTITNSKSTGVVNGDTKVGGLVGENNRGGSIINSYSTATVSGDIDIGGLVGCNSFVGSSTISYCYSAGKVTGNISVGGLVGEGSASTDVINCFWDKDIVGFIIGVSGKPVTTTEMQTTSTFLEAGWDFVDETENGTEDIWWIDEGNDYPRLWWEPFLEPSSDDLFFLVVDNFESYGGMREPDLPPNRVYITWIDGWDDPNNGSIVGYSEPPYCEQTIVHSGWQSMPYFYDNSGPANYSEATASIGDLDFDRDTKIGRNWIKYGATVLSMWFYGDPNNAPETMYVALANYKGPVAEVYHDNPEALLIEEWNEWRIDLQDFADQGVNLTNINSITIGFGDRDNPQPGGSGLVFFDDIRLYRPDEQADL